MIEITTQLLILTSILYGGAEPANAGSTNGGLETLSVKSREHKPATLEEHVRDYFKEEPIMAEIARCESTFRHLTPTGEVMRGTVNKKDIGVMQINERYHAAKAEELGFDIHTLEGNLGYAKWLYGQYGTKPWVWSSKCWKTYQNDSKHIAKA